MLSQHRFALKSLMCVATLLVPQVALADVFGAIAYSSNGAASLYYSRESRDSAESLALRHCTEVGGTDCYVAMWFVNTCGAIARGDQNAAGWSWNNDLAAAERDALFYCSERTSHCTVILSGCAR